MDLIIAVDPATTTGLAWYRNNPFWSEGDRLASKSVRLAEEKALRKLDLRFFDPRPVALRRAVHYIIATHSWLVRMERVPLKVLIAFEDVQFAHSLAQVQLWGSLRGALWTVGEEFDSDDVLVSYISCPVGTLKRHATGHGGATKQLMAKVAAGLWPGYQFADDNEIDARFLLRWALEQYQDANPKS